MSGIERSLGNCELCPPSKEDREGIPPSATITTRRGKVVTLCAEHLNEAYGVALGAFTTEEVSPPENAA